MYGVRVTHTFRKNHPLFEKKVKFINLEAEMMGDRAANMKRRFNEFTELAKLGDIRTKKLLLMKFCAMTSDRELRQKICVL